jgi:hypothetical protein
MAMIQVDKIIVTIRSIKTLLSGGPIFRYLTVYHSTLVLVGINITPVISTFLTDALLVRLNGLMCGIQNFLISFKLVQVWRLYVIWGVMWMILLSILLVIASTGKYFGSTHVQMREN